jgi:hypothetical protein
MELVEKIVAHIDDIIIAVDSRVRVMALIVLLAAALIYLLTGREKTWVRLVGLTMGLVAASGMVWALGPDAAVDSAPVDSAPVGPVVPATSVKTASSAASSAPKRYLVSLDGQQSKSIARWVGNRSRSFDCQREVLADFDLVVVSEKTKNIGRTRGRCLGRGSYCDSYKESCIEVYYEDACLVNRDWHEWYTAHLKQAGLPYSKQAVCAGTA